MNPTPLGWIETEATVTVCKFQTPGLGTLAFGFSTRRRFLISFDYYAHGRLYSGQFQADKAIPQNERIPVAYNPLNPEENNRAPTSPSLPTKPPLLAIGIAGSIILSLLWLGILRSCN